MVEFEPPYHNVEGVVVLIPDLLVEAYTHALEIAQPLKDKIKYKRIIANLEANILTKK